MVYVVLVVTVSAAPDGRRYGAPFLVTTHSPTSLVSHDTTDEPFTRTRTGSALMAAKGCITVITTCDTGPQTPLAYAQQIWYADVSSKGPVEMLPVELATRSANPPVHRQD